MDSGLIATASAAEDFTLIALFVRADLVVRLVMIALALASIWSWAVSIDKWIMMAATRNRAQILEEYVQEGLFKDDVFKDAEEHAAAAMARILAAGAHIAQHNAEHEGMADQVRTAMHSIATRELSRMEDGLSTLAIIGSTAPFIGLFGTVWGIMNSFRAIAIARETNLAVVAPGIAEALFATALGLAAAIPAVVFYNKFSNDIEKFRVRTELFAEDFVAYSSRQAQPGDSDHW